MTPTPPTITHRVSSADAVFNGISVNDVTVSVLDNEFRFDFGSSTSPVASGYFQVTEKTFYSAAWSYGWTSGRIHSVDRGTGTALTRDFNYTSAGTFAVDLPNGNYPVTLVLSDQAGRHDQMGVFIEGQQVDSVTLAAGAVVVRTYQASVTDGQLTLLLQDLGGADPNAVINGLEVGVQGGVVAVKGGSATGLAGTAQGDTAASAGKGVDQAYDASAAEIATALAFGGLPAARAATVASAVDAVLSKAAWTGDRGTFGDAFGGFTPERGFRQRSDVLTDTFAGFGQKAGKILSAYEATPFQGVKNSGAAGLRKAGASARSCLGASDSDPAEEEWRVGLVAADAVDALMDREGGESGPAALPVRFELALESD